VRRRRKRLEALRDGLPRRVCPVCGGPVAGRAGAVYCGSACRLRANRARGKPGQGTPGRLPAAARGRLPACKPQDRAGVPVVAGPVALGWAAWPRWSCWRRAAGPEREIGEARGGGPRGVRARRAAFLRCRRGGRGGGTCPGPPVGVQVTGGGERGLGLVGASLGLAEAGDGFGERAG